MILFKIAIRNVRQHKAKTLIVGSIIALGIMSLVIGNSLMDTAQKGMEKMFIDNYTGNLFLHTPSEKEVSLFGAMGTDMTDRTMEKIQGYEKITDFLKTNPAVKSFSPQIIGFGFPSYVDENDNQSGMGVTILWGIDTDSYRSMFRENIDILEGKFISDEKPEILLSKKVAEMIETDMDQTIHAGDSLLITGMTETSGTKIREVTVAGIFAFKESSMQLDMVSLVDPMTARTLTGMNTGTISEAVLLDSERELLGEIEENDLFGGGDLFAKPLLSEGDDDLYDILGETSGEERHIQVESSAWHFLLVRLHDNENPNKFIGELETFADENDIPLTVAGWREGAGPAAEMSYGMQTVFNVIILVISVVAIIIIMNTLVISVTERIPEIGTIRAIGAQKKFVRGMIVWETLIISGIFGLIGIGAGCLVLGILNLTGIEATNIFLQLIFGGKTLQPVVSFQALITSLVVILGIGIVSSLYPTIIALKIEPVKAMRRG